VKLIVGHWVGPHLVEGYESGKEYDISPEEIVRLFEAGYEVMLHHVRPPHQTRKELARNGQLPDGTPCLFLDEKGKRFTMR